MEVFGGELGLGLLLAGNLLLFQFLHLELKLVEMVRALFLGPMELLAMELL